MNQQRLQAIRDGLELVKEHGEEVCARCIAVNALAAAGEPQP